MTSRSLHCAADREEKRTSWRDAEVTDGMLSSATRTLASLACAAASMLPGVAHAGSKRLVARSGGSRSFEPSLAGTRGVTEEHVHVRRGDNLGRLLASRGVGYAETLPWLAAATRVYDLRQIRPRQGVSLRFDRATHALQGIRYEIDDRALLVLEKDADGTIRGHRTALPYFTEVKGIATTIT